MRSTTSSFRFHPKTALLAALASIAVVAVAVTASTASGARKVNGGTLVVGMTAANIPNLDTLLAGGQGYEGDRFVGNQLYDGLTKFDLKQGTSIPKVIPDLATSWKANATGTVWNFTLRPGVKFQDGTPWNADAVIFNLDRYVSKEDKYSSPALQAEAAVLAGSIKSYAKTGPMSVKLTTTIPDAHLPSDLTTVYMASPTAVMKEGSAGFAAKPVGTGPFMFKSEQQGRELDLVPYPGYWGGAPKLSELILKPIPDPSARIAAIRSGAVNWIEYPNPDDISSLENLGFKLYTNSYDHIWPWIFDTSKPPWNDVRVRQAANYAIDRVGMATDLLKGTADPAYQIAPRANTAYSPKNNLYSYDPKKAKALLAAAGYSKGFTTTVEYPTSGSGNMVPVPMNELLQQELGAVGIKVILKPIEWSAMLGQVFAGKMPAGIDAMNISLTFQQESSWEYWFTSASPINIGKYKDTAVDKLIGQAQSTVSDTARAALYEKASALITKDAAWLFVVNDRNPRVLAPTVHGFVEPMSWFVDLTNVTVS
ncbi:MAG TPA: ABC transporter substrate-binding protein [Gaiellaceae bacterium]|nr:ABC transporter substrate-binding protein [Gaiellaceae bacterium]